MAATEMPVAGTCYDVFTRSGMNFIGRMPMTTLSRHYMLHRDAEERIKREALNSEGCTLFFNRSDTKDIIVFSVEDPTWVPQWDRLSATTDKLRENRITAEAKDVHDGCRYRGYLINGSDSVGWTWMDGHNHRHIKGHGVAFTREEVLKDIDASMISG